MISRLRPVAFTASLSASSSNAFIDIRSIGSIPAISDRIDGSVGPLKPAPTPTVVSTIGMSNAFAVFTVETMFSRSRSRSIDPTAANWDGW